MPTTCFTGVCWVAGAALFGLAASGCDGEVTPDTGGSSTSSSSGGTGGPMTLVSGAGTVTALAVDTANVYWTSEGGTVFKVPIAGGAPVQLANPGFLMLGIAVDATSIYCIGAEIIEIPLEGGEPTKLATGGQGIALDSTSVYWTTPAGTVQKMPLGGGPVTELASGLPQPTAIAVDAQNAYWADYMDGTVNQVPIGGGEQVTLASGQKVPQGITVGASRVYWTAYPLGLGEAPVGGGAVTSIDDHGQTWGVVSDETHVYWALQSTQAGETGSIQKVPVGGGPVVTLLADQGVPTFLAVDATSVYWVDAADGTIKKAAK